MKKVLLSAAVIALMASCGESAKNQLEEMENDAKDFASGEVTDPLEFNDGIMAEITLSDVKYEELSDLDDQNVPAEEMIEAANDAIAVAEKAIEGLGSAKPVGKGGQDFIDVAVKYTEANKRIAEVYLDFAEHLATPDEEWTDEAYDEWTGLAEPVFAEFDEILEEFIEVQEQYGADNGFGFEESIDPAAIYEESKDSE